MEGIEPGVLAGLSGAVLLLAGVVTAAGRRIAYRSGAADQRSGLPVYEVAMLAGGAERAAETALAYLVLAGLVEVRERASTVVLIAPQLASPEDHPAEAALLSTISLVGTRPNLPLSAARTAAQPLAAGLRGLLIPPGRSLLLQMLPGLTGLVVAGAGVAWLTARAAAGLPVGLTPITPMAAVALTLWALLDRPRVTAAGDRLLERLRAAHDHQLGVASVGVTSLPPGDGLLLVALYGRRLMTGGLGPLRNVLDARRPRVEFDRPRRPAPVTGRPTSDGTAPSVDRS